MVTGDPTNTATAVAMRVSRCMNLLGGLAAPRVFPILLEELSPEELRQHIVEAIVQLEEVMAGVGRVAALSPVRDALAEQELSPPSGELVAAARAALAEFGIPEPPEGWDNWEHEE